MASNPIKNYVPYVIIVIAMVAVLLSIQMAEVTCFTLFCGLGTIVLCVLYAVFFDDGS